MSLAQVLEAIFRENYCAHQHINQLMHTLFLSISGVAIIFKSIKNVTWTMFFFFFQNTLNFLL